MQFPSLSSKPDRNFEVACYVDGVFVGYARDSAAIQQAVEEFVAGGMQASVESDESWRGDQVILNSEDADAPAGQP